MNKKKIYLISIVIALILAACVTPTPKPTDTSPLVIKEATPTPIADLKSFLSTTPTPCPKTYAKANECLEVETLGMTFQITNRPLVPQSLGTIVEIAVKKPGESFWTFQETRIPLEKFNNFTHSLSKDVILTYDPKTGNLSYKKIP